MQGQIDAVIDELTLAEKLQLVHGAADPDGKSTGYVPGIERVDIPPIRLVDGPLGVRAIGETATAFPASIALAASWDPTLARDFGAALGRESIAHEQDVVLGPGVNIIRTPTGGRNFEYYSEDPHLASRIGVGTIDGIQSENVAATVKHFVANNQEENRLEVSADVSERALREIYLPAFRAAVQEADVAAVMSAYNRVNGTYMDEHERLLRTVLKDEWGFDGFVMSDWYGTRSTVAAANAGLDLEMPGIAFEEFTPEDEMEQDATDDDAEIPHPDVPALFGEPLRDAVEDGAVDEDTIDEKVERILGTMASVTRFEDGSHEGELDTEAHRTLAREIVIAGSVLLKNDGALPLDASGSVAVIGPNADTAKLGGGGSSEVTPTVEISPVDGIRERSDAVTFERGVEPITETSWFAGDGETGDAADASIDAAVAAADDAGRAVVVVQDDATEFLDRDGMALPGRQDELVSAVADATDHTTVVLRTSGPVELPWLESVDAVLQTWYPGQADGDALGAVLFGEADPGGRLPVTFGQSADEYPTASEESYPGTDDVARYDEGVFVGYRYFDRERIDPVFPFGHGLSYAEIEYGDVSLSGRSDGDGWSVDVPVRNRSDRAGTAVVQVYARKSAAPVETPSRELAAFERVELDPSEGETVTVSLSDDVFSYYDEDDGWSIPQGTNEIHVGASVRDIYATFAVDTTSPSGR
ncbi:MAG: beta-glucosidase [Haloarcula sp.]